MKLKNKILILLLISIAIILFFNIKSVFAVTATVIDEEENSTLFNLIYATPEYQSGNYHLFVGKYESNRYRVFFLQKVDGLSAYYSHSGGIYYYINLSAPVVYKLYELKPNATSFNTYIDDPSRQTFAFCYDTASNACEFYSDIDVYADSSYNDFFFKVPVTEPETPTPVLELEVLGQVIQTETPLKEILAILPLIIVVVVSLVGLRKALQMLLTLLKRS